MFCILEVYGVIGDAMKVNAVNGYRFKAGFLKLAGVTVFLIRITLFYILLWVRIPIVLVLQAVTSLAAVAFLIMVVVRGWSNAFDVFWPLLVFSFCAFVLNWVYDGILMLLSPEDIFIGF